MKTGRGMDDTAVVFDIQRFSLHDGPGIRTAVFLKSCPLGCLWCHNPESRDPNPELSFDRETCSSCGACLVCPNGVHGFENGTHTIRFEACTACGACASACPSGSLTVTGRRMTVEEVMEEVRADIGYYGESGGGLTVTGGEPLSSPRFLAGLLEAARSEGIGTAIETSGFAQAEAFEAILPLTDLFLFDCKAVDPLLHRILTGADNGIILSNLEFLCSSGSPVVLRCPIVPGINDSRKDLEAMAVLATRLRVSAVEILPYHPFARDKYARKGLQYPLSGISSPSAETVEGWKRTLEEAGCEAAVRLEGGAA